jgi:thymidylate synthase
MVDYKDDGGSVNQIANAVGVLRRRGVDPIPIVLDRPGDRAAAHIGFPCLSLIQFHKQRPSLNCSAVYRSHYYHDKAYGNFLGLARLHQLVARECGLNVGELTVLSTQAQLKELAHMTAVLRAAS